MSAAVDSLLRPSGHMGYWSAGDFPEEAVGFRLVRILPGERLRPYEGFRWRDRGAMAQFLTQRMLGAGAYATADYALADVLDADYNIVAEFGIATPEAFRRLQRKLRARVESTDGDPLPQPDGGRER